MLASESKTIFEYQELEWSKFSNIDMIRNSVIKLEKQGFKPFSYTANGIKARQYVGVVSLSNMVIQVLPKVFNQNDEFHSKINIKGLMYLLSITKKLKISETEISKLSKFDSLLEVFINLFAHNLLELLHNDFQRNYVNQEDNLQYVKGKIDFTQHIRYNYIDKSKFYCKYDEYEDNILLNQLFKATIKKCINFSKTNFAVLQKCDYLLSNVEDKNFTNPNICNQIKFNRQNQGYKYVFELAKLLLFGNSPKISSENISTFSIMFDMNKLFEEVVYEIIKRDSEKLKIDKVTSQSKEKSIFNKNSAYNFTLQPDVVIEYQYNKKIIIDTKYKLIDVIKPEYNSNQKSVNQADIYQMFAYSQYYGANKCILLYPKYNNLDDKILENNSPNFTLQVSFLDFTLDNDIKLPEYINKISRQLQNILI